MSETIICFCRNVSEATIVAAVNNGATSLGLIKEQTGACTGHLCRELNPAGCCCSADILAIIERATDQSASGDCNGGCCGSQHR